MVRFCDSLDLEDIGVKNIDNSVLTSKEIVVRKRFNLYRVREQGVKNSLRARGEGIKLYSYRLGESVAN